MNTPPVRVERRVGQRFPYLLPLSFRQSTASIEGVGFTQDLSSRGVFFFTDAALNEGAEIQLTLKMPSEITLGESMRVCCRGRILRVVKPPVDQAGHPDAKIGVAVKFEGYEYLNDVEVPTSFPRVAALHPQHPHEEERPLAQPAVRPILG
jgi:hypothetical protein